MSMHAALANALVDTQAVCPDGIFNAYGPDLTSRFAVYRNNVHSSLINALVESYPVALQWVGDAFFRAMAQQFVRIHPPQSPLINDYGEGLADFIKGFAPAAGVPYLADICRLERLRVLAYHAGDEPALSHEQLRTVIANPSLLIEYQVTLHPSLHLLDSAFAVVAIWATPQDLKTLAGLDVFQGQHALVLRDGLEVLVFAIDKGSSVFIRNLQCGQTLGEAVVAAPAFDLTQLLTLLIRHHAITGLRPHEVSP